MHPHPCQIALDPSLASGFFSEFCYLILGDENVVEVKTSAHGVKKGTDTYFVFHKTDSLVFH